MLDIIISGCNGYMGRIVAAMAEDDPGVSVAAGFDIDVRGDGHFPVYFDPMEFTGAADVVVDFSDPSSLGPLLDFCLAWRKPPILCTTGYSPEQLAAIDKAAEQIPVFRSGNMSLGLNLLIDLVKRACEVLGEAFDVEIVERHHRRKIDSPSGTALMLADAVASAKAYSPDLVFERQSRRSPRGDREVGISSVRGGTVVGVHEVVFAGLDEVIELKHTASSREIFAVGALRAAKFMANVDKPGLYGMADVLNS